MSQTAVAARRTDQDIDLDWVVLHEPTPPSRVQIVGKGAQRRGKISRSSVRRSNRSLVALPSLDDLTS